MGKDTNCGSRGGEKSSNACKICQCFQQSYLQYKVDIWKRLWASGQLSFPQDSQTPDDWETGKVSEEYFWLQWGKKQITSVLVLILECKFSVIATPKQQQPLSHLQIMGAVILQEQQTMAGKRRCSEEAVSVLQRTLHLPYLRDLPFLWVRGASPITSPGNQKDW